jgi:hypothetical protein
MTENTENQTENTTAPLTISPRAGLTRGVRLVPDPDGILASTFIEQGSQMGYVYVYGEESPAVFDGKTWHPIISADVDWFSMHDEIAIQYHKIVEQAKINKQYEELASYVGVRA